MRYFVRELRRPVEDPDVPAYPVRQAHDLYRHLFGPVESTIRAKHHFITIPTGDLLSLPFAVLVTDMPPTVKDLDYSVVPWMIG